MNYDIFVSYVDADRAWVEGYLLDALRAAGVQCLSEAEFPLGVPRLVEFERAVKESRRTLLVISPAYLADEVADFTDVLAQSYGLETAVWPVIPLVLEPVELPPRLAMLAGLDASDVDRQQVALERLLAELKRPLLSAQQRPECPYPGMRPFEEKESSRFFGRKQDVQELIEQLHLHPFVAVIGPSGCGKSSLVFAGLVPALSTSSLLGSGRWQITTVRPGAAPVESLRQGLRVNDVDDFRSTSRALVIVDQFEEVFTLAPTDIKPFSEAISKLIAAKVCVVLTVRSDFYSDLMSSPIWPEIRAHRLEVTPLDADGLRQAIMQPAEQVGVYVEAALVERLVADAADEPGILPFVQETLVMLWDRLERHHLPLRAYEALVLSNKAYQHLKHTKSVGLYAAMARWADEAYGRLSPEQQAIARRIFIRLVQYCEGRAPTRRQQMVGQLRTVSDDLDAFDQVLHHLIDSRLLTASGEEGVARRVDIAHEALITGWSVLNDWLKARRDAEDMRRRLDAQTQNWIQLDRRAGYLDRVELAVADRWLTTANAKEVGVDLNLRDFLHKSRRKLARDRLTALLRPVAVAALTAMVALVGWLAWRDWLKQQAMSLGPSVHVAGGQAAIGTVAMGYQEAGPPFQVQVPTLALDQHEVTNEQYCLCRRVGACSSDPTYTDKHVCDAPRAKEPVTNVTILQADQYCKWIGGRLPTEIEWEWSARGPEDRVFPTGKPAESGKTNILSRGTAPQSTDGVKSVFEMPEDTTPSGIRGMAGNVREWTVSLHLPYDDPRYLTFWPADVEGIRGFIVTRGGSWKTWADDARSSARYWVERGEHLEDLGFRCLRGPSLAELTRR